MSLPSNSSLDLHPNNKTSNFKVRLNKELSLENYRVALSDIIYMNKFQNVSTRNNKITFGYSLKYTDAGKQDSVHLKSCELKPGICGTIEILVNSINEVVRAKARGAHGDMLSIDGTSVKILKTFVDELTAQAKSMSFTAIDGGDHSENFIIFENRLAKMLGFHPNVNLAEKKPEIDKPAPYPSNMNDGFPNEMFVYTDFIEHQLIGNSSAPLLKIVPINMSVFDEYHEKVRIEFINRNYVKLNKVNFQTVNIECRDSQSNPIPFEDGHNIILTLHFIKQRKQENKINN